MLSSVARRVPLLQGSGRKACLFSYVSVLMGLPFVQVRRSFSSVLCIHQGTLAPPGGIVLLYCFPLSACVCFYAKFQASVFSYEGVVKMVNYRVHLVCPGMDHLLITQVLFSSV